MNKKLVVSFPGGRTGSEVPLLYFGAKHFENAGYEKLFINHPMSGDNSFEAIYRNAESIVRKIKYEEYEDIVFIAKSLGTEIACMLKEEYKISASLVLFTPLNETLPYIHKDNQILLLAAGDKDRYLSTNILQELCEKENIPYYIEPGVGHRMEVINDMGRDLEIIGNVLGRLPVYK